MSAALGIFVIGAGPSMTLAAPHMIVPGAVFMLMHANTPLIGYLL